VPDRFQIVLRSYNDTVSTVGLYCLQWYRRISTSDKLQRITVKTAVTYFREHLGVFVD